MLTFHVTQKCEIFELHPYLLQQVSSQQDLMENFLKTYISTIALTDAAICQNNEKQFSLVQCFKQTNLSILTHEN